MRPFLFLLLTLAGSIAAGARQSGDALMEQATEVIFFDEDYAAAIPLLERCIEAYTAELGAENHKTLAACFELGGAYARTGRRKEAAECFMRFAAHTHLAPADAYLKAIRLFEEEGDQPRADSLYAAAHEWHKKAPTWRDDMRNIYLRQYNHAIDARDLAEAGRIASMQLELLDCKVGANPRTRMRVMAELAEVAAHSGNTAILMKYGPLLVDAYESIPEASRHADAQAMSLCVPVAMYYSMTGRHAQADGVWRTAMTMKRPAETMEAMRTGYATFLSDNGRSAEAFGMYSQAAAAYASAGDYAAAARAAFSMATLARQVKDWSRLREACSMAASFTDALRDSGNYTGSDAADINSALASLYFDLGDYDRAAPIYEQVLDYYSRSNMPLATAMTLVNLGACRYRAGHPEEAVGLYRRASSVVDLQLYPELSLTIGSNTGSALAGMGDVAGAAGQFSAVLGRLRDVMASGFVYMTEAERQEYWDAKNYIFDNIHNLPGESPDVMRLRFDAALANKGILLDASLRLRSIIEHSCDSALIRDFARLGDLLRRQRDGEAADGVDQLTRSLQQRASAFGDYTAGAHMTSADICSALGSDECAVEIVRRVGTDGLYEYDALIADATGRVDVVSLPSQSYLDGLAGKEMYTRAEVLSDAFWGPILERAGEKGTIYISPDGAFHAIAFEYLPVGGKPLASARNIVRLSSTRQLPVLRHHLQPAGMELWGGLDYNSDLDAGDEGDAASGLRGLRLAQGTLPWRYLPGTRAEVDDVAAMAEASSLPCEAVLSEDGTEDAFKGLSGRGPDVLHIATHGFFFPKPADSIRAPELLNSGLILAGANNVWNGGSTICDNRNDGVLTSAEIARLDLPATRLVVLSACQSGLGDIAPEGVFGLPRAFKKSGVGSIVMALWPVDDVATKYVMTAFYRHLLGGSDPRRALAAACSDLTCEKLVRPDGTVADGADPALWAAFVIMD